jgi:hypothetical protein
MERRKKASFVKKCARVTSHSHKPEEKGINGLNRKKPGARS